MKILAIEFSSEHRSLALLEGTNSANAVLLGATSELGGRRALALVEETLQRAGCEREQIDCIAVGIGPGSYTGIRGAIALAQGWQLGREIKLLGISSVACLAAQVQAEKSFGAVNIVIDAQRNEFYLARYEIDSASRCEVEPLRLATFDEVNKLLSARQLVLGPEITRWFPQGRNLFPEAVTLGRLALERTDFVPGEKIEPIYLRETNFKKAPPLRVIV
jgi:tRNA threonylcarbamoyl adenosine modification protein YeaZ